MTKHHRPRQPSTPPEGMADATGDDTSPAEPGSYDTAQVLDDSDAPAMSNVAALESRVADQQDKFLRLAAEYDNFRKRSVRERQEAELRGMSNLIRGILDPLDDIGRFAHVDRAATDVSALQQGVEMVEKKLLKSLAGHGLEIVNPVEGQFDPAVHEALSTVPAETAEEDHTIAQVYQVGYVFNGQLLRAARVVVRQWKGLREGADTR